MNASQNCFIYCITTYIICNIQNSVLYSHGLSVIQNEILYNNIFLCREYWRIPDKILDNTNNTYVHMITQDNIDLSNETSLSLFRKNNVICVFILKFTQKQIMFFVPNSCQIVPYSC